PLVDRDEGGSDETSAGKGAEIPSGPGELPDRVVTGVGDVEIASPVEGDATRHVQPGGREVAQVLAGGGELANPGDVGDIQVAVGVEREATRRAQPGRGEVPEVVAGRRELPDRVAIDVR